MLRWPESSRRAIARLFRGVQDLDIFVEDVRDEQFYSHLFRAAAPAGLEVRRVVGLGGRHEVLRAATSYVDPRRALFVIDGDFAWVRGELAPDIPRVYRLEMYCIENLLAAERPVIDVYCEEAMCDESRARAALDLATWRNGIAEAVRLFVHYALLNSAFPEERTIHGAFGRLVSHGAHGLPSLDSTKIDNEIRVVRARLDEKLGPAVAESELARITRRVSSMQDRLRVVSGKEIVLPLLRFHVKKCCGTPTSFEVFRYRLARKCDVRELGDLRRAFEAAA